MKSRTVSTETPRARSADGEQVGTKPVRTDAPDSASASLATICAPGLLQSLRCDHVAGIEPDDRFKRGTSMLDQAELLIGAPEPVVSGDVLGLRAR
jgi:hypothetical protein